MQSDHYSNTSFSLPNFSSSINRRPLLEEKKQVLEFSTVLNSLPTSNESHGCTETCRIENCTAIGKCHRVSHPRRAFPHKL